MQQIIKKVILSFVIVATLEHALCSIYSYFYVLNGNEPLSFSISRMIAMLVIYWGTSALMYVQKSPDYGIN